MDIQIMEIILRKLMRKRTEFLCGLRKVLQTYLPGLVSTDICALSTSSQIQIVDLGAYF